MGRQWLFYIKSVEMKMRGNIYRAPYQRRRK
jgi:hypothetical protein